MSALFFYNKPLGWHKHQTRPDKIVVDESWENLRMYSDDELEELTIKKYKKKIRKHKEKIEWYQKQLEVLENGSLD